MGSGSSSSYYINITYTNKSHTAMMHLNVSLANVKKTHTVKDYAMFLSEN